MSVKKTGFGIFVTGILTVCIAFLAALTEVAMGVPHHPPSVSFWVLIVGLWITFAGGVTVAVGMLIENRS